MTTNPPQVDAPGQRAGRPLDEWNEAYARVENHFCALRVRNKLLLGQLVIRVMHRAMERAPREPDQPATTLATEEMDRVVMEWLARVLHESPDDVDHLLSAKGRLALLLADMPGKWQDQFLRPDPWPEEFVSAMRETFLRAGPEFQLARMAPRPLDLGPIVHLTNMGHQPWLMGLIWIAFALFLIITFILTH